MYTLNHSVCNSFATERATVLVEKRDRSSTTALGGLLVEASANAGPIFPQAHLQNCRRQIFTQCQSHRWTSGHKIQMSLTLTSTCEGLATDQSEGVPDESHLLTQRFTACVPHRFSAHWLARLGPHVMPICSSHIR